MCSDHMASRVEVGRTFQAERRSEKEQSGAGESERGAREEGTWGEGERWAEHPRLTLQFSSSLFLLPPSAPKSKTTRRREPHIREKANSLDLLH